MLRRASVLLAFLAVVSVGACSKPEPPISVSEGMVTVVNQTDHDWKEVLITVNDHFRGFVPVLKADGRANAPLSQFNTGYGQYWSANMRVRTIDVTAKSADGSDVKLTWGREREAEGAGNSR
ncbi:MAG TPA: hypothetical protein VGD94_07455 [Vicinamibacterales bacterium]